ncbi:hypothetical protein [Geothrix paludis]|uniref:hypothetical protein n=1 Tax=Geothrix paludis TaxID=2922722 RepID=UPI001FAC57AD|nr:hypothetical protein [Geothrix paludis]
MSFISKASLLAGAGLLTLAALGCNRDQVSHYRVPKESAAGRLDGTGQEAPSGPMGMPPADGGMPAPPRPSGQGSLKWSLPQGWSEVPGEGMRFATFKSPVAGKNEATVVVLPGAAGGELANVNRWRGQIGLGPIDEAALAAARKVVKTKAGALNVYDFTSEGQTKSRMVAGLISTPDGNTWFLKLTGDADPVAKAKPDFMRILESLRLD